MELTNHETMYTGKLCVDASTIYSFILIWQHAAYATLIEIIDLSLNYIKKKEFNNKLYF